MTERLYYTDSHLTHFDARVVAVNEMDGGRSAVLLNRTAFYPTGGGQPTDTGTLGAARVVECIDREEAGVIHVIEGPAPQVGSNITGRVDWPRRLDHIQQHTGQHILSQAFVKLFGAETRSFRMMEDFSEIDVALDDPSDERIERAVDLANQIIWEDRAVCARQFTADEAARLPLRKDVARAGELRIIEIEDFDMTPCGGTHARRTGEVGLVAVRSWERAKGLARIDFVAGARALADYRRVNREARQVAALFSVGRDEAAAAASRMFEENKNLLRRQRALEEQAARAEADELLAGAIQRPDGARIIARLFDDRDMDALRKLAQAIIARPRMIALLGARDSEAARLVFARSEDLSDDMSAIMRAACGMIDGRGGGRPSLAQGGGRATERLHEVLDHCLKKCGAP